MTYLMNEFKKGKDFWIIYVIEKGEDHMYIFALKKVVKSIVWRLERRGNYTEYEPVKFVPSEGKINPFYFLFYFLCSLDCCFL